MAGPAKSNSFISDDFLLQNKFAKLLYHDYAKNLPIIDYHNHLPPDEIAADKTFENITRIWLNGDHYKWRAMRTVGVNEKYITGNAADDEKFSKWAHTVPFTVRNPLYHWTHLELQRYFDIDQLLSPETEKEIYKTASTKLQSKEYSTRGLLNKMKVEVLCTTDDPTDNLQHHKKISSDKFNIKVLPTFRPDKVYDFDNPGRYNQYIDTLSEVAGIEITNYDSLIEALGKRIKYFQDAGCKLSDHGLTFIPRQSTSHSPSSLFGKIRQNEHLTIEEKESLRFSILTDLCKLYHKHKWVQQFHIGAMRNNNSRMMQTLGADSGFDSVGDFSQGSSLAHFLNELDKTNELTRTILYNLNSADNELFATMTGNFNDGSVKGKIQYGSAWWFLDQKDGMEKQINTLSSLGILSCFIGMITDSRSFLSFPRHEYFRRILCNLIGADVERGELPADEKWLGKIVSDICYYNAKAYFEF